MSRPKRLFLLIVIAALFVPFSMGCASTPEGEIKNVISNAVDTMKNPSDEELTRMTLSTSSQGVGIDTWRKFITTLTGSISYSVIDIKIEDDQAIANLDVESKDANLAFYEGQQNHLVYKDEEKAVQETIEEISNSTFKTDSYTVTLSLIKSDDTWKLDDTLRELFMEMMNLN